MSRVASIVGRISMLALCGCWITAPAGATSLGLYVYSMDQADPDTTINEGGAGNAFVPTVGDGLGVNGFPVLNANGLSMLNDFNVLTSELLWWSTDNPHVTPLNNPVYPATVTLPFADDRMFTNTTVLGANGDNGSAFLTAMLVGHFTLSQPGSLSLNVCSDDDGLVYLSGGQFGKGTLVLDNGGIHGTMCTSANVNASMLSGVPAGNYTMRVFYADREQVEASLSLSLGTEPRHILNDTVPEPSAAVLMGLGLAAVGAYRKRSVLARLG